MAPRDLGYRIRVMLAVRMVVVLGVGALVYGTGRDEYGYVFWVAGLGLSAGYALWLRSNKQLPALVWAQIMLDQLLFTFVVYLTGGPTSGATSLYGLTCLGAAILLGSRAAMASAALGISCYVSLSWALGVGWLRNGGMKIEFTFAPLLLNAGGVLAVAALASYLASRLAQTGGELVRAEARAEAAERHALLGRVAAGLAHEIRNPLSSISASVEMLAEAEGLNADDRMLCEIVQREVMRLNELVSDMMDLTKPRTPDPRVFDVAQVIREVVALAQRLGRAAEDVRVIAKGAEAPIRGLFDASQFRQVLWNLVKNAVEASFADATVTVRLQRHADEIEVRVEDEGQGMTEAERAQVFDAFFTRRTKGSGLGLAGVRRIVDDHNKVGATLEVESEKDRGTTFLLRFHAADLDEPGIAAR